MPKQGVLLSVPKQPLPLRLTVGKGFFKRNEEA